MKLPIKTCTFLLTFFICGFSVAWAQTTAKRPDSLNSFVIDLKPTANSSHATLPFHAIKIIDARFDTSKVGYAATHAFSFKKFTVKSGLQQMAAQYLNDYYSPNFPATDSSSLVVVVNTLWLHQINLSEKTGKKFINTNAVDDREVNEVIARFDVYLEQGDHYKALYRVDTTFDTGGRTTVIAGDLLLLPFYAAIDKLMNADITHFLARQQSLSYQDIYQHNTKRFDMLCLTGKNVKAGVYITFHDFVNGTPVYPDFTIEEGKLSDELYIEQNGAKVLLADYWGFCDGVENYIHLGFNFFPFYKQGNTFEFWGNNHITHDYYRFNSGRRSASDMLLRGGAMFNKNKTQLNLKPMQIDMQTGTAY